MDLKGRKNGDENSGDTRAKYPTLSSNVEDMMKDFDIVTLNAPSAGLPASITLRAKNKSGSQSVGNPAGPKVPGMVGNLRKEGDLFIVPISGDMQRTMGLNMSNHGSDAKKKKVGELVSNFSEAQAIAELSDRIVNFDGSGNQPMAHTYLPSVKLKDGKEFRPQLIISPKGNKVDGSAGDLGVYKASITTPNGTLKPVLKFDKETKKYTGNGEFANIEGAVKEAFDLYKELMK